MLGLRSTYGSGRDRVDVLTPTYRFPTSCNCNLRDSRGSGLQEQPYTYPHVHPYTIRNNKDTSLNKGKGNREEREAGTKRISLF